MTHEEAEEAVAREVQRLRREHPGWSIWNHRRSGHPAGLFNATPKDADSPKLAAATASELRTHITAAEQGTAGEPTREDQTAALKRLERECVFGLAALPLAQTPQPHLAVSMYEADRELVVVANRDGAWAYVWADGQATHPVGDPIGAARRIMAMLVQRRRQTQEKL